VPCVYGSEQSSPSFNLHDDIIGFRFRGKPDAELSISAKSE